MRGPSNYDYVIVGAGPAGLQMAYFLQKSGRKYVVYEAENKAAAFFDSNPRNGRLISINKKYNKFKEDDFNMRHDWNSLLSDDPAMRFTKYSDELYPQSKVLHRYMNDYAQRFQLNIEYGTEVIKISKRNSEFFVTTKKGDSATNDVSTRTARCVLMASGAVEENIPENIEGAELADSYAKCTMDKVAYRNKLVLIAGGGNSAFEFANYLADTAAIIHVSTRKNLKFAWNTHYVGDLRAVNNTVLDMYHLKSLHGNFTNEMVKVEKTDDGMLLATFKELNTRLERPGWVQYAAKYHHVILCLGWRYIKPEIFDDSINIGLLKDGRFPKLNNCWETDTENLFYIGTTMAAIDRKAASGFVHGFRYNIRTLHNLLENRLFKEDLPHELLPHQDLNAIYNIVCKRVSTSASLYQMNGFLCDVILFDNKGHTKYYIDLPKDHAIERPEVKSAKDAFVVTLQYGSENFGTAEKPIDSVHGADFSSNRCAELLHPVIEYYSYGEYVDQTEFSESLVVRYDDNGLKLPQWSISTTENYVKHFINEKMHWTEERFNLMPVPQEFFKLNFVPLTEEEKSRIPLQLEHTECESSQDLLPKHKLSQQKEKLRPTMQEKIASAQIERRY